MNNELYRQLMYPNLFFSYELQHHAYVHTFLYILERLSLAAPRECVHSGLVLGLDGALPQLSSIFYLPCLSWPTQQLVICPNDSYLTLSQLDGLTLLYK
jgi:hypothetical protein